MASATSELTLVPASNPLLGHINSLQDGVIEHIAAMCAQGDFVKGRYLHIWAYFVSHPDLIQEFLVKRAKSFHKDPLIKRASTSFTPENVFISDGDSWKAQRKLMQPAFHSQRIGAYADAMVAETQATIAEWGDGAVVPIDAVMADITMRIIVRTMFNTDIDFSLAEFGAAAGAMFRAAAKDATELVPVPRWVPSAHNQQRRANLRKLATLYLRVIDDWRAVGEDRGDLLSMLMLSRYDDGSPMSDAQVMSELNTIFLAGHETTATTLTFAAVMLSEHPAVAAKLQAEVDRVLAGRPAALADLKALTYTEQVIKETMRLYPAATGARRTAIEAVELGGHTIKQGEMVTASFWSVQRDPRWYDDPLQFQPERWTPEFEAALPRYAYLPFGAGPRVCIGNQFAMMEAQLVLATLAQRYSWRVQAGVDVKPSYRFTLHPGVDEVPVTVRARSAIRLGHRPG